ncbi:bifunctional P-450/NADPH-P450 reductase 1 [Paenibacillus dendritiformis]|uniref:NADPH--hemoprotein reductase n=1 Tax=Paenibacillus dendritiformis C454 TaxID=1131935 RepID=H3SDL2_9BACL|nr:bifunctional P-450/NADPH-P450 reductase 1 [Paenibacillus dendritiformis]EHQ62873.1 putative bifunctional P-450/NADPH-P450 reductase 1 [Paenibacillus dendritiformis C454]CAH8770752.1 hypothetical protein H7S4_003487 [Paenibacillus dendritiformis]
MENRELQMEDSGRSTRFLQARAALKQQGMPLGEAHLYFGYRNEADFIYRGELEQYEREGIVTLHTAFSRAPGVSKTYVQHLMNAAPLNSFLCLPAKGGFIFAGTAAMLRLIAYTAASQFLEPRGWDAAVLGKSYESG